MNSFIFGSRWFVNRIKLRVFNLFIKLWHAYAKNNLLFPKKYFVYFFCHPLYKAEILQLIKEGSLSLEVV